jgi:hypothetical protein
MDVKSDKYGTCHENCRGEGLLKDSQVVGWEGYTGQNCRLCDGVRMCVTVMLDSWSGLYESVWLTWKSAVIKYFLWLLLSSVEKYCMVRLFEAKATISLAN